MLFCHAILFYTLTWNKNDFTSLCQHSLINVFPVDFFTPTNVPIPNVYSFFIYEHNTCKFILINTKMRINSEGGGTIFKKCHKKLRIIHFFFLKQTESLHKIDLLFKLSNEHHYLFQ